MILSSPINSPNFVGKLIFFQHVIIMSGTLLDRLPMRCKKKKKSNDPKRIQKDSLYCDLSHEAINTNLRYE